MTEKKCPLADMINMPEATESLSVMPYPRDAAFNDDKCKSSFVARELILCCSEKVTSPAVLD